jgi:hypothetical protein
MLHWEQLLLLMKSTQQHHQQLLHMAQQGREARPQTPCCCSCTPKQQMIKTQCSNWWFSLTACYFITAISLQESPQCMFTLSAFSDGSSSSGNMRANKHQLQVTSISWSKTGQTLAASFGRYAHARLYQKMAAAYTASVRAAYCCLQGACLCPASNSIETLRMPGS